MTVVKALRSKFLLIPVGLAAFVLLFAWLALPALVKWQAEKIVLERSGHQLSLGTPEINPLKLTVRVPTLSLQTPQGEPLAAFEEFYVDLSGTDLFTGLIALDEVRLLGLQLHAVLLPDGATNFTPLIDAFKSTEPDTDPPGDTPALRLAHLLIGKASIDFQDQRTADGLKTRVEPIDLELRDLATRSEEDGDFELNATTTLGAELALRAKLQLANPSANGTLNLKGLELGKLAPVLKALLPTAPPSGQADVALSFDIDLQDTQTIEGEQVPKVEISQLQAQVRNFAIQSTPAKGAAGAQFKELNVNDGAFSLQGNTLKLGGVGLTGLGLTHAAKGQALALNTIQTGPVAIDLTAQQATVGQVTLQGGQVNASRNAQGEIDWLATANAWAAPKTTSNTKSTPSKPWAYRVKGVKLSNVNIDLHDATQQPALALGLTQLNIQTGAVTENLNTPLPIQASVALRTGGDLTLDGTLTPATAAASFDVALNALNLKLAQPVLAQFVKLDLASGLLSSKGKATYNATEQGYKGSFELARLRLNERGTNTAFLSWNTLGSPQFSVNASGLNVGRLSLDGLDTAFLIAKDKTTNVSRLLIDQPKAKGNSESKQPAPAESNKAAPAFLVTIGRFTLANSELDFADDSLFLPFGTRIHNLQGSVNGLSTKPGTRGEIALQGTVDEFGEATAQGSVNLMNPTEFLNMAVKFTNLEMRNLTPYTATFANRKIESGKLSLNLDYRIENNQLNSSNQVVVDRLTLGERVQSPQARDLPLDLAVALLQDSKGRIELGLPITGDLNDPQFSVADLVWKTLGNVLSKIVTAPFRALGALLGGAGEEELGSVAFNAGQNTLSPPQREKVSKLGQALKDRPKLFLTLRGTFSPADKTALQNLQMRKAVAKQAGESLANTADPGPLAFSSESTQQAIEAVFEKRFGAGELASLKTGFRQANPDKLEQSVAGQALGQIANLFKETRELSAKEVESLKGQRFHDVLAQKLQNSEDVSEEVLRQLGTQRGQTIFNSLTQAGVDASRLQLEPPKATKAEDDNTVAVELGVTAR